MIKLIYFDFNFWRIDILRLSLSYSKIPYNYERIPRNDWKKRKNDFPFGQLPIMIFKDKMYSHTHSLAHFCAKKSNLYDSDESKALIIDQVLDWANEITNKIAPSIRAAMREKNFAKSEKLRKEFIKNDLNLWFSYLENLLKRSSSKNSFFTGKFSIADITAWRVLFWFASGKLDQINDSFLNNLPSLKNYYEKISNLKSFSELIEFKEILSSS